MKTSGPVPILSNVRDKYQKMYLRHSNRFNEKPPNPVTFVVRVFWHGDVVLAYVAKFRAVRWSATNSACLPRNMSTTYEDA